MPARNPLLIVNPIAGNGRAHGLAPRIEAWLGERSLTARLMETRERGHAERLAAAAGDLGHDRVVVVGGDGTIQEVVNGLLADGRTHEQGLPSMGLVPAGTGNDLVRDLALPLDPFAALAIALGEQSRAIDVARAEGEDGRRRFFAVAGGVGFDGKVAHVMFGHRYPWQRGRSGYMLSTIVELLRWTNRRVRLTLETPDGEVVREHTSLLVAFANGPYYGGGMQICPGADVADGLIDICVAGDLSRMEAFRLLPGIYRGAHVGHPKVEFMRARSLRIDGDAGTLVHLDGEPFGALPVTVHLQPGALHVTTADGVRPADD
ncbi:MAG TPA: diacylglycerol kinase family protein [Candidatus Limnocylindria bacterium]|nr:diacylglycerol kinase family protein [Candidatus Limnocylindria bacterium]